MVVRNKEEDAMKKNASIYFLICKELSNDDVGATRVTLFQEMRPGAGFKTIDSAKKEFGGLP